MGLPIEFYKPTKIITPFTKLQKVIICKYIFYIYIYNNKYMY